MSTIQEIKNIKKAAKILDLVKGLYKETKFNLDRTERYVLDIKDNDPDSWNVLPDVPACFYYH